MKRKLFAIFAVLALIFAGTSCSKDTPEATSRLQLKLTDAPLLADSPLKTNTRSMLYSEINIDIQGVDIYVGNTVQGDVQVNNGWISLNLESTGVVNLLDFMNGEFMLLVDQQIPACTITKVKFKLGSNCTVKTLVGEEILNLKTNGSFTFDVNWNIEEGEDYSYVIDLDASLSVSVTLDFNPEPFINTFIESFGGNVYGYVHPATAVKYIKITKGTKTFYTIPDLLKGAIEGTDTGLFAFICLEPGDWVITFVTKDGSGFQNKEVPVTIEAGKTFKFPETIELEK